MSDTTDYLQLIKESFDPKLISALYKNFSNQYIALQELLDNSVEDKISGQKLVVTIKYSPELAKIVIKNVNGSGMDIDDLKRFFTWGVSNKKSKIGRYGQGGKAAIGYLAKSFLIKSHPIDSSNGYLIKVDDWEDRREGFKEFRIEPFKTLENKGSVTIELWNLKRKFQVSTIKNKISEIYRPLILNGDVKFIVNTDLVECLMANYDEGTKQAFTKEIVVSGKQCRIFGEYGLVSDKNSPRGGFNIYNFDRKIAGREYFGHLDPSKKWSAERLYGEIYVNFIIPLLMNKTDLDRDSTVWKLIKQLMYDEIKPTVKLAIDYRSPTKKEIRAVRKVVKKVEKFEGQKVAEIELFNYGSALLFKVSKGKDGKEILKINREHQAYKMWSSTDIGKRLYIIMIYALYRATSNMSKKDAARLRDEFSISLAEYSEKLLK